MSEKTISQLLYDGATIDPAAAAVQDGDATVTFADLIRRVESAGAWLLRRVADRGSRVGICAENHFDHLVAYLAILVSGHVWVPLNPANGKAVNAITIDKAKPELVLVDRNSRELVPESDRVCSLENLQCDDPDFHATYAAADDVAAIKFTGGTTGEPKGVVQTHANMLAVIENMQAFFAFDRSDRNLIVAPLTHGASHYVIPVLAAGGRHRFPHDRTSSSIVAALRDDTTLAFMPPTLIYKLLRTAELVPQQFPRLRHLTYSAAPMPPERIAEAQGAFGPVISALYGQTEAPMTICALGTEEMRDASLRCTVGRACYNSSVRVVDDEGRELSPGGTGNIEARGPIVMAGYLDDTDLTSATIHDGWLKTGDRGSLDESGYLTLSGRASEVIISGGFNIYPAEIENVLARAPGIRECCVFAVADEYWGERIEAAVVCDDNAVDDDVLEFVRDAVGPVRMPKALHRVRALPRNAVGKVVRRDMPGFVQSAKERRDG